MSGPNRTVRHIVLVKFRDDASDADRAEFVRRSQWSTESGYTRDFTCGWQVEPNVYAGIGEAWDWAMTVDYDADVIARYREDPVHRAVGADVGRFAERYAIVDIAIG